MKVLQHDLALAKVNLANGKLSPERFDQLHGILDGRLRDLEAEVHARLLVDARVGRPVEWQRKGGAS